MSLDVKGRSHQSMRVHSTRVHSLTLGIVQFLWDRGAGGIWGGGTPQQMAFQGRVCPKIKEKVRGGGVERNSEIRKWKNNQRNLFNLHEGVGSFPQTFFEGRYVTETGKLVVGRGGSYNLQMILNPIRSPTP